jgi:hypothetical protein
VAACSRTSPEDNAEQAAAIANYVPPYVLSRLDFGGVIERRFRRLDRDGNDRLTPSELLPRNRARAMLFDTDHDGTISAEEWSTGMLKRFDEQDLNHDGTVTSDERERARVDERDALPTPAEEPATNKAS